MGGQGVRVMRADLQKWHRPIQHSQSVPPAGFRHDGVQQRAPLPPAVTVRHPNEPFQRNQQSHHLLFPHLAGSADPVMRQAGKLGEGGKLGGRLPELREHVEV